MHARESLACFMSMDEAVRKSTTVHPVVARWRSAGQQTLTSFSRLKKISLLTEPTGVNPAREEAH